jgi:hypothetical protein
LATDLDEVRPAGSDAESDDVLAAVAAAVARDAAVQAELAAAAAQTQRQQYEQYASDSGSEGEAEATWPKRRAGAKPPKPAAAKPELHRFAGSSSEDEEDADGVPAVIDFGGVDYEDWQHAAAQPAQQQPAQKRAKKERAGANKGTGPSVRPGELVHAGTHVPAGAQAQLFAGSGGGGDGAGGAAGSGFAALGLSQQLAEHMSAHNFSLPTRVQQEAIPLLLAKRDALVNAPTGSGKTLW